MTVQERLESLLEERGLQKKHAEKIVKLSIPEINKQAREVNGLDEDGNPINPYKITWERPDDEYDKSMYVFWFASIVKPEALKWVKKNTPEAWFKPMFE